MADNNPFQSVINPNAARTGLWDMRMMSAANRMETPFERGMGRGYPRSSALSNIRGVPEDTDFSRFTYDPALRQQAIEAGVTPLAPDQVKHNTILPNSGFFGSHPRLSAAIEGGLYAGLASHGGSTIGESIQGTMEGIVGGRMAQQNAYRAQFAQPFAQQDVVEGLRDKVQRRELQEADIQHLRAVNQHLESGDDYKAQQLMETNRHNEAVEAVRANEAQTSVGRLEATSPRNLGGGLYGYYNPTGTGTNQKGEWSIQENPESKTNRSGAGAGPWYSSKDPKTGKTTFGRVHEGQSVPEGAKLVQGDYAAKQDDKEVAAKDRWVTHQLDNPASMRRVLGNAYNPKDSGATTKALEKWYDENFGDTSADAIYDQKTGTTVARPRQ